MLSEQVLESIEEFLIVYIHSVAYVCQVYPADSFKLVQQYRTATYENNHPGVQVWAENASKSVMQLINTIKNSTATVSIVVLQNHAPIVRFGIQLQEFQLQQSQVNVSTEDVIEQFRSCIVKLLQVPQLPDSEFDRSMTLLFEGKVEDHDNWIKAEATSGERKSRIHPIRSVEIKGDERVLVMNCFRQLGKQE